MFSVHDWSCSPIKESVHPRADLEKGNRHGQSMGHRFGQASFLVLLMLMTPLSGCFGQQETGGLESVDDVVVTPPVLSGGVFQGVTISAGADMAVFVPYLMLNSDTGFVQNSTVVDMKAGETVMLTMLAPPRTDTAVVMLGEYGRENWPIRSIEESWRTWIQRDGNEQTNNPGIQRVPAVNGTLDAVLPSNSSGGAVLAVRIPIERPMAAAYSEAEGGSAFNGVGRRPERVQLHQPHVGRNTRPNRYCGRCRRGTLTDGLDENLREDALQYYGNLESFGLQVITSSLPTIP